MRPLEGSTLTLPLLRLSARSVRSTKINGLYGTAGAGALALPVEEFPGKVMRYRAVWLVTVISVWTEVFRETAK